MHLVLFLLALSFYSALSAPAAAFSDSFDDGDFQGWLERRESNTEFLNSQLPDYYLTQDFVNWDISNYELRLDWRANGKGYGFANRGTAMIYGSTTNNNARHNFDKLYSKALPFGFSEDLVQDSQISVSSINPGYLDRDGSVARLDYPHESWIADTGSDPTPQITIDLLWDNTIEAFATQGAPDVLYWTTNVTVEYQTDAGGVWNAVPGTFTTNTDQNTTIYNEFSPSFSARYIRFTVTGYNTEAALRMEIFGTPKHFNLGMYSAGHLMIADEQITNSSQYATSRDGIYARLNSYRQWRPETNANTEWLAIDLLHRYEVTMIAVQAFETLCTTCTHHRVTTYDLSYSEDGETWTPYSVTGLTGAPDTFEGIGYTELSPSIIARHIRIEPQTWSNRIEFRCEVYGALYDEPSSPSLYVPGPYAWTDYTTSFKWKPFGRNQVSFYFRYTDVQNHYEVKIFAGQDSTLTVNNQYMRAYSSTSTSTVNIASCTSNGRTSDEQCLIDEDTGTILDSVSQYKPAFYLDFQGLYIVDSVTITMGTSPQTSMEIYISDTGVQNEPAKYCGSGSYSMAIGETRTFECYRKSARYVWVQSLDTSTLSIAEIVVDGPTIDPYRMLVRKRDGRYTVLDQDSVVYPHNVWQDVTVTVNGNYIDVEIDDSPIFSVSDPEPLPLGTIGFGSSQQAYSRFDDVIVTFNTTEMTIEIPETNQMLGPGEWKHYSLDFAASFPNSVLYLHQEASTGCCLYLYNQQSSPPSDTVYDDRRIQDVADSTSVIIPAPTSGTYYFGVYASDATVASNTYQLTANLITPTSIGAGYAENNTLASASEYHMYKMTVPSDYSVLTLVITPDTDVINPFTIIYGDNSIPSDAINDAVLTQDADGAYRYTLTLLTSADEEYFFITLNNSTLSTAGYEMKFILPVPVISEIEPVATDTIGNIQISLTGSNFHSFGTVYLDGTTALSYPTYTADAITFVNPEGQGSNLQVYLVTGLGVTSNVISFSYNPPVLDSVTPSNGPTSGGVNITLTGSNFGLTPNISFAGVWLQPLQRTHSTAIVRLPRGSGTLQVVQIEVAGQISGVLTFDYDPPAIQAGGVSPLNGPTDGGTYITIRGANFGSEVSVDLAGSSQTIVSNNDTVIVFSTSPGEGIGKTLRVTVSGQSWDHSSTFSYDGPAVAEIFPANGPTIGGVPLTLRGSNFGLAPSVTIGGSDCSVTFNNHSHVVCSTPVGQGALQSTVLRSGSQSSASLDYNYDPPVIDYISPGNVPARGGDTITIDGRNFGTLGTVDVDGSPCSNFAHYNHTHIICEIPPGDGLNIDVISAVSSQISGAYQINYDAPVITSIENDFATTAGNVEITLHGYNFGPNSGDIVLGGVPCPTAVSGHTNLFVKCVLPAGSGLLQDTQIVVNGQSSNIYPYNYGAPSISRVSLDRPNTQGGSLITIIGSNFGPSTDGGLILVGRDVSPSLCTYSPANYGHTQIICSSPTWPEVFSSNISLYVNITGQRSNRGEISYAHPSITSVLPSADITNGGTLVTISGSSFSINGTVTIDGNPCHTNVLGGSYSHTKIVCEAPEGQGANLELRVLTQDQKRSAAESFSYNAPNIDDVVPSTSPTYGGVLVDITGTSLGLSGTVTIAGNPCSVVSWNHGQVQCYAPEGVGNSQDLTASVSGQSSSISFNYDPPVLDTVSPINGPTQGGINITLTGSNFGVEQGNPTVAGVDCPVVYQNHSKIICTLPAGSDGNKQIQVVVAFQVSNTIGFAYDGPILDSIYPTNGPTQGATLITLVGQSFGPNPRVTFGTSLAVNHYITDTLLKVWLPAGSGTAINVQVATEFETSFSAIKTFNYDPPNITHIEPVNGPTSGIIPITLYGENFGSSNTIIIDGALCAATGIGANHTTSVCTLPEGSGLNVPITVTVGSQVSPIFQWNYRSPNITSIEPTSGTTEGGDIITIKGTDFSLSGVVLVDGASCAIFDYIYGHEEIQCVLPAGAGANVPVSVTTNGLSSPDVEFDYIPPVIDSWEPLIGPTEGQYSITIQGSNFGANGIVRIDGNVCEATGAGYSHNYIECVVPPGEGNSVLIQVNASNQFSPTGNNFIYDDPVITNVNPANGPTAGGTNITLTGSSFGLTGTVSIDGVDCPVYYRDHGTIKCVHPEGLGTNLDLVAVVGTALRSSNLEKFSYDGPRVTAIQGCVDIPGNGATELCDPNGSFNITIIGENFGRTTDSIVVFAAGSVCLNEFHDLADPHHKLVCQVQQGTGYDQPIYVTISSQDTTVNLLSYSGPTISPNTIRPDGGTPGPTHYILPSTTGSQVVEFDGAFFGSDWTKVQVKYGVAGAFWVDTANFDCPIDSATFTSTHIECTTQPGIGGDLVFSVSVDIGFTTQYSPQGTDTVSYPQPHIQDESIRKAVGDSGLVSFIGSNSEGEDVIMDVNHIGAAATEDLITVFYGFVGGPYDQECTSVTIETDDTTLKCRTSPQVGEVDGPYVFRINANGQLSAPGNDTYFYPDAPKIYSVSGCNSSMTSINATVNCPTVGGTQITIRGDKFTTTSLSVKIGADDCLSVTFISANELTCEIPPGVGTDVSVVVVAGELFSRSKSLLSYALPIINTVSGCTNSVSYTEDCNRAGGDTITLDGQYFGLETSIVFIGGQQCGNVIHDPITPDKKLTCTTPPGTGLNQPVFLVQNGGELTLESSQLSYKQCAVGYYAAVGVINCTKCPVGSYADQVGSFECKQCESGYYAEQEGSETCDACSKGTYSTREAPLFLGAVNCTVCPSGRYGLVSGQADCIDCAVGTYNLNPTLPGARTTCYKCSKGSFADSAKSTGCSNCTAGSYAGTEGTITCSACPGGRYQEYPGQSICLECDPGSFAVGPNAQSCTPCDPGQYINEFGKAACVECDAGTFSNASGLAECYDCPVGSYSVKIGGSFGAQSCTPCEKGFYINAEGQDSCLACSKGRFTAQEGQTECSPCAAGKVVNQIGRSTCNNCTTGTYYPSSGGVECTDCEAGSYSKLVGMSSCTDCEAGRSQDETGKTFCDPCAEGSAISGTGQLVCTQCNSGTYANATGQSTCISCQKGRYSTKIGLAGPIECTACDPGYFISSQGQSQCEECPVGTYQDGYAATRCFDCPAGTANSVSKQTQCTNCTAGDFAPTGGYIVCDTCAAGTYSPYPGSTECFDCAAGRKQPDSGMSECSACDPGFYLDTEGGATCKECGAGTFSNSSAQTFCYDCPAGRAVSGSQNQECDECLAGTYMNSPGQAVCLECPVGSYTDTKGQSSCIPCAKGTATNSQNSQFCTNCTAGRIASGEGFSDCVDCPAGRFAQYGGKSTCTLCPVGRVQPGQGESGCNLCDFGEYMPSEGQQTCIPCDPGSAGPQQGLEICETCVPGKIAAGSGETVCSNCTAGDFQSSQGQGSCDPCDPGKYSPYDGAAECLECEKGEYQDQSGESFCLPCDAGDANGATGQAACTECVEGKYSAGGAQECISCGLGEFSEKPSALVGPLTCQECIPGEYGPASAQPACKQCAPGYITSAPGQDECTPCDPGSVAATSGLDECSPCGSGKFVDASGAISCANCPAGKRSSNVTGSTECIECPAGYYQDGEGKTTCKACTPGTYNGASGQPLCLPCEPGFYQDNYNGTTCVPCPAGEYQPNGNEDSCLQCPEGSVTTSTGQAVCVECDAGTYTDLPGLDACIQCDAGTYSVKRFSGTLGATECFDCLQGYYIDAKGQSSCLPCPVGTFALSTGSPTCSPCGEGTFADSDGTISCDDCDPGTFSNTEGTITCSVCEPGTATSDFGALSCDACLPGYAQPNSNELTCDECENGYYTDTDGAKSCKSCPTGTYGNGTAASACNECEPGKYQDVVAQTNCTLCPKGEFSASFRSKTCDLCPAGTFGNTTGLAGDCNECAPGTYQPSNGEESCLLCEKGFFNNGWRSESCDPCEPGYFSNVTGSETCTKCPAGTYQNLNGKSFCKDCPRGEYSNVEGQPECIDCPSGRYGNVTRLQECIECDFGYFQGNKGQPLCEACPPGSESGGTGATECTLCNPGYYSNVSSAPACSPCLKGKYQNLNGKTACEDCARGEFNDLEGVEGCAPCDRGTYMNETGATACIDCPGGTFQNSFRSPLCQACPEGRASNLEGLKECTACEPGNYQNISGATSCRQCEIGRFQTSALQTACTECIPGRFSDQEGREECTLCDAGEYNNVTGSTECEPCEQGRAQAVPGSLFCELCDPGYTNVLTGQIECARCEPGYITTEPGQTSCDPCDPGSYNPYFANIECYACPNGTATSFYGQEECADCGRGKYSNETGALVCRDCEEGRFQPSTGEPLCDLCPAGFYQNLQQKSFCEFCEAGKFSDQKGKTECTDCLAGTHQPATGESICLNCTAGFETLTDGEALCTACDKGYFNPYPGRTCQPCALGSYTDNTESIECTLCEKGRYSEGSGLSTCEDCTYGKYQSQPGQDFCDDCSEGRYQDVLGSWNCTACAKGTYQGAVGQRKCQGCISGFFANTTGLAQCFSCPMGTYQTLASKSFCDDCQLGRFNPGTGQETCFRCDAGEFANQTGSVQCYECQPGRFQQSEGQDSCDLCESGTYSAGYGAAFCDACPTGKYGPTGSDGLIECPDCLAGTYNPLERQSTCLLCTPGTWSLAGASLCEACGDNSATASYGSSSCTVCSDISGPNFARTECLCDPGYYLPYYIQNSNAWNCDECPEGADCDESGRKWNNLPAQEGFYRPTNVSLNFYRCFLRKYCTGGLASASTLSPSSGSPCASNREGVLCDYCQEGYREEFGGECNACPEVDGWSFVLMIFIAGVLVFLIWLQLYVILRSGKSYMQNISDNTRGKTIGGMTQDDGTMLSGSGSDFSISIEEDYEEEATELDTDSFDIFEGEPTTDDVHDEVLNFKGPSGYTVKGPPLPPPNFTNKLKIFLTFLQISTNIASGLEIQWPSTFKNFILYFDVANADFILQNIISADCVSGVDYYVKFLFLTLAPVVVLLLVVVLYILPKYFECFCFKHQTVAARQRARMRFWRLFLYILFLIYPGLSSTVLRHYVCKDIDEYSYLRIDLRVECYTDTWWLYAYVGTIMILLYPIGIPVFFFIILFMNRRDLRDNRVRGQLGFLYAGYREQLWFFELIDTAHKLFVTSVLAFFPDDAYIPIGMVALILYFITILIANPWIAVSDDRLHLLCQSELFILLLAGWVFYNLETAEYTETDDIVMSIVLLIVFIGFFCVFLWFIFQVLVRFYKRWKQQRDQRLKDDEIDSEDEEFEEFDEDEEMNEEDWDNEDSNLINYEAASPGTNMSNDDDTDEDDDDDDSDDSSSTTSDGFTSSSSESSGSSSDSPSSPSSASSPSIEGGLSSDDESRVLVPPNPALPSAPAGFNGPSEDVQASDNSDSKTDDDEDEDLEQKSSVESETEVSSDDDRIALDTLAKGDVFNTPTSRNSSLPPLTPLTGSARRLPPLQ